MYEVRVGVVVRAGLDLVERRVLARAQPRVALHLRDVGLQRINGGRDQQQQQHETDRHLLEHPIIAR